MKKKVIILLMALVLICSLVFMAVACGPKAPTKPTTKPEEDKPGVEETDSVTLANVQKAIFGNKSDKFTDAAGIYAVMENVFGATDGVYLEGTLYVDINGTEIALNMAVNADPEDGSKNKAYVGISNGGVFLAQVVMDSEVIYFGDGLTQEDTEWFALDQAEDLGLAEKYLGMVTSIVATMNDASGLLNNKISLQEDLAGIVGIVDSLAMNMLVSAEEGTFAYPKDFDPEDTSTYAGDYAMTIDLSTISGLLGLLKSSFGLDINALLEGDALKPYKGIIDMVVGVILGEGNTLDKLIDGELDPEVTPNIEIRASVAEDLALSGLGIYYKQPDTDEGEGLQVSFGIKNLYIGKADSAPKNSIFPADYDKADDIALQLSLEGLVPSVLAEKVKLTGYIVPDISLSMVPYEVTTIVDGEESVNEYDYIQFNMEGLYGFATAQYDGKDIDLNVNFEKVGDMFRLSFDLDGLFKTLGYTGAAQTKFYYDFDMENALNNAILPKGAVAVDNAEADADAVVAEDPWKDFYTDLDSKNEIDSLYKTVAGIFYNGFNFGALNIGGIIDNVMSVFTTVTELATDEDLFIPDGDEDASGVTLNISGILEALLGSDLIEDSELLGEDGPIFSNYGGVAGFLDSSAIIENIATAMNVSLEKVIANISAGLDLEGYTTDNADELGEYLLDDLKLEVSASRGPVDIMADLTIDGDTVIKLSASVDLVSADDVADIKDELSFGGSKEPDYDGYVLVTKDLGDMMKTFLDWFVDDYMKLDV